MALYLGSDRVAPIINANPQDYEGYNVRVIDYDGTVLKEAYLPTGATFTLPTPPIHDRMTFQEWVYADDSTISGTTITVGTRDLLIGAFYEPTSGLNEFDFNITVVTGKTVTLNMNGEKDWGDGTVDSLTSHTYKGYGNYTVTCDGTTITASSTSGIFGNTTTQGIGIEMNLYCTAARLATVTTIPAYAFSNCRVLETITLSSSTSSIGNYAFYYCRNLKSITLPSTSLTVGAYAFYFCNCLRHAVISRGVSSLGNYALAECRALEEAILPIGVSIGTNLFRYASVRKIWLNPTSTVGSDQMCQYCYIIEDVILPNTVTTVSTSMFYGCYVLRRVVFPPNLATIAATAFFFCYALEEMDFSRATKVPTLTDTSFSGINGNCVIKVPFSLYDTWIAATNWTMYKDNIVAADYATLSFITSPSTVDVYVNKRQAAVKSVECYSSTASCVFYDYVNNVVKTDTITGVTANAEISTAEDLTSYNKITLSTGASGLDVKFIVGGITFTGVEETSGNYVINVVGSGVSVGYSIEDDSYMDASGTITSSTTNVTETITLTPATISTWTRPNLSANGTIGGNAFAVEDPYSSSSGAYKAVDSDSTTYWNPTVPSSTAIKTFILYNPTKICITSIAYTCSSSYYINGAIIFGSNDGESWERIPSSIGSGTTSRTLTVTNTKYYKYYRMDFQPYSSSYCRVLNMAITATYKAASS